MANKLLNIYVNTKLNGEEVNKDESVVGLIDKAKKTNNLYRYKKDMYLCSYKVNYEGDVSIMMLFTMKLPNSSGSGSSSASEMVMTLIKTLEDIFIPIHHYDYRTEIEGLNKNVGVLKIIKKIDKEDLL